MWRRSVKGQFFIRPIFNDGQIIEDAVSSIRRLAQVFFQGFQRQALVIHGQAAESEMGRLKDLERLDIRRVFNVNRRPAAAPPRRRPADMSWSPCRAPDVIKMDDGATIRPRFRA